MTDARLAEVPAVFPNVPALRLDGPLADSILLTFVVLVVGFSLCAQRDRGLSHVSMRRGR